MESTPSAPRFALIAAGEPVVEDFAREVQAGLGGFPKSLPCRFFYDAEGSRLFEEICKLKEYYIPAAEEEILRKHAGEIAASVPAGAMLVELGSGCAEKTRVLIEALLRRGGALHFVPIDISRSALEGCAARLLALHPALHVSAVCGEYRAGLAHLRRHFQGPKLVLWLGSNIGNFDRGEAAEFLGQVGRALRPDDRVLVGVDLRKDKETLRSAYDDPKGVTARFNRNILSRINRELGGHFDLQKFRHVAYYNESAGRVEMFLVSTAAQRVQIEKLELVVDFKNGEAVHTEDSYKYSPEEIEALAQAGGLRILQAWTDGPERFRSVLLAPA
ncbi:MAG: L-histidine N(alpha)-methyltransferase [Planctomycetota bacterium]|nr:MAG: L-histidine N(alpha)-methyltransferase [Planctomycetota bacterium]